MVQCTVCIIKHYRKLVLALVSIGTLIIFSQAKWSRKDVNPKMLSKTRSQRGWVMKSDTRRMGVLSWVQGIMWQKVSKHNLENKLAKTRVSENSGPTGKTGANPQVKWEVTDYKQLQAGEDVTRRNKRLKIEKKKKNHIRNKSPTNQSIK